MNKLKDYLKLEIKKTIFSWKTVLCTILTIVVLLGHHFSNIYNFKGLGFMSIYPNGVDYFITLENFSYIGFIAPIILSLVYSTSIIKERNNGFMEKLLDIIKAKDYFKVKFIVNAIATGSVFFISQISILIYFIIRFKITGGNNDGMFKPWGPLASIYNSSSIAYVILIILITTLSAIAFSTFMLGFITICKKKYLALLFPIFYVVVTGVFFQALGYNVVINFNVTTLFSFINYSDANVWGILGYDIILILLGCGILNRLINKVSLNKSI